MSVVNYRTGNRILGTAMLHLRLYSDVSSEYLKDYLSLDCRLYINAYIHTYIESCLWLSLLIVSLIYFYI